MERHQLPMGKAVALGRGSSPAMCSGRPMHTSHQRTSGEPKGEPGRRILTSFVRRDGEAAETGDQ